jgi:hypothetical protein
MNIYTGLLFQQGYIQDPQLAVSLAQESPEPAVAAEPDAGREPAKHPAPRRAWFRSHAVSFVCCTTALSPFR